MLLMLKGKIGNFQVWLIMRVVVWIWEKEIKKCLS